MSKKYFVWTIGCQMNKAESERLADCFENLGYQSCTEIGQADLILLNTCVVRQSAENKVINKLHILKRLKIDNPELLLMVTGCFVDPDIEKLKKNYPFVDHFFKAGSIPEWLTKPACDDASPLRSGITAYVSIIQGCNNFCSYCIVPYRRGREHSLTPDEVACEIKSLVERGVKEVTLLGQNVDSYGHDLPGKPDLAGLLARLNTIPGLLRIRFLTNHPKDMQPALVRAIAKLDKVCEQINLPVQAGDNEILKSMNRDYTVERYRELVREIRKAVPEIAMSTDLIVGFPGESESQFQSSYDLLSEIKFDLVHVAAYSPRMGTMAAREFVDDIPLEVKKERVARIEALQAELAAEINARLLDTVVEILVEGQKDGKWYGRTRSDKLVFFRSRGEFTGTLVNVKIKHTSPWSLTGERVIIEDKSGENNERNQG